MSQLRNQLKDITFDDLTAANIQLVGGRVYADSASRENVNDLVNVQNAWQAVHAPTYGNPIPSTGVLEAVPSENGVELKIVSPGDNEVYRVFGFFVENASVGSLTFTGSISDTTYIVPVTELDATIAGGKTVFVPLSSAQPLFIDKNVTAFGKVNEDDIMMGVVAIKVVQ